MPNQNLWIKNKKCPSTTSIFLISIGVLMYFFLWNIAAIKNSLITQPHASH